MVCAWLAFLLLGSILKGPDSDPHGYVLVFGSMLLIPSAVVGALVLPFVAPGRSTAQRVLVGCALVWMVAALALAVVALGSGDPPTAPSGHLKAGN